MSEPEIRKGRKFDQVLQGARRVFLRDGFDGASVDEIAREAGVSKATLYSYFADKRLLFTEICNDECRRQVEQAELEIAEDASAEEILTLAATRITGFLMSDFGRNMFRLVVAEASRFPEIGRVFFLNGPGFIHARLSHHLGHMVEKGMLRLDDPDLAAEQFAQLCKAHIHERLLFGLADEITPADVDRTIRGAVEMFLARYGV
ncbi:TetR/AcrR family transcriptional regulator [Xinfangfangia sp. CPCC 101601]|uniref:TetR/AcrR family transcriptional regulator n=1 Tax=Pseudogemmobacter lacusdianii TaxID=3069608 RepID=A0ABU0VYJ5_9RHOB|nr:TetR/AcrR family transcriptional regulator [Xinfangfangia sp. CPCC 101601]MDQ2066831.1 TetR/AcrR family transcriptional regulator [Xinfangfangia sp. CPCC 101601]